MGASKKFSISKRSHQVCPPSLRSLLPLTCYLFLSSLAFASDPTMFVPFSTYTYSSEGWALESPHAYVPVARYTVVELGSDIRGATNMISTPDGWLYIANAARNNILIFDERMRLVRTLSEYRDLDGEMVQLNGPEGMFIHERTGSLYVAESGNQRIIEFSPSDRWADFTLVRYVTAPESGVLPEGFIFTPTDLVLDTVGRMFILVRNNLMGLLQLDANGEFTGFFGAQQVERSAIDAIREFFMTDEQRERMIQNVPRQYNNLAIDDHNFIWLTTNAIPRHQLVYATMQRSRDSSVMPIRRMNMNGNDVLVRSGAFPPTGDVVGYTGQPSAFVDITLRDNLYAALDRERNKIFTYDMAGNLLYAFGGSGMQRGVFSQVSAIAYRGTDLLVLDTSIGTLTVFERTAYGTLLEAALEAERRRDFTEAYSLWRAVLRQNNNFDMAYTGIARMMMRRGDYAEAMQSYRFASDIVGYSRAFGELRRAWIRDYYWIVPLLGILLIFGIVRWFMFANRLNTMHRYQFKRYHLGHELLFGFYTLFHPIGGFWDLKHEKRGSMQGAHLILSLVIFTFIFSAINTGYIFNQTSHTEVNILQEIMNVLLPVLMWCTASWALTTLFDGQARLRDIYMVTCSALLPLALTYFPAVLMSNVLVLEETMFLTFVRGLGAVWSVLLIFSGVMTLQEYGLVKNTVTTVASMVLMGVQLFIGMLFILLGNSLWQFLRGVYQEIVLRM